MAATALSDDARLLRYYRHNWDRWVEDHLDIQLARYRSEEDLVSWLERQPEDAHVWCRQRLASGQLTLDSSRSYQAEFLHTMSEPGWYIFRTANGAAKTATAAMAVLAFLDLYTDSRALTTAGTWSQLQEQLWREIPIWASRAKRPIVTLNRIGRTGINLGPDWAAFGRGADKAETFEGVHAPNLMVVVDEAKAVESDILLNGIRRIMREAEGSRTWFLVLSSPGSPTGTFYDMCVGSMSHRFTHFHLSAYESQRISLDQLGSDAEDLGEDSPLFVAMNLGEFPQESEDTIIPLSWAQSAVNRSVNGGMKTLGVDVARMGGDSTAMVSIFGRRVVISDVYNGQDTVWTTGRVAELHAEHEYDRIGVDDTGVGGDVVDMLRRHRNTPIIGIDFGAKNRQRHPERYVNNKTEMYFLLRGEFEAGHKDPANPAVGLSIPADPKLIHQLTCQRYDFDTRQRYFMESKRDLKGRNERSPDMADALAIANFVRPMDPAMQEKLVKHNTVTAVHKGVGARALEAKW